MSGTTSSWSHANVRPVRPSPDWISSATISTSALVAQRAHLAQEALGRDDHAALALDRLEQDGDGRRRRSPPRRAAMSPYGTMPEARGVRRRSRRVRVGSSEKLTIVVVRPWKLPSIDDDRAPGPPGRP